MQSHSTNCFFFCQFIIIIELLDTLEICFVEFNLLIRSSWFYLILTLSNLIINDNIYSHSTQRERQTKSKGETNHIHSSINTKPNINKRHLFYTKRTFFIILCDRYFDLMNCWCSSSYRISVNLVVFNVSKRRSALGMKVPPRKSGSMWGGMSLGTSPIGTIRIRSLIFCFRNGETMAKPARI